MLSDLLAWRSSPTANSWTTPLKTFFGKLLRKSGPCAMWILGRCPATSTLRLSHRCVKRFVAVFPTYLAVLVIVFSGCSPGRFTGCTVQQEGKAATASTTNEFETQGESSHAPPRPVADLYEARLEFLSCNGFLELLVSITALHKVQLLLLHVDQCT